METKHIKIHKSSRKIKRNKKHRNNKKKQRKESVRRQKKNKKKLILLLPRNLPPNSSPLVESRPKYSNMEQCQEEAKQHFF